MLVATPRIRPPAIPWAAETTLSAFAWSSEIRLSVDTFLMPIRCSHPTSRSTSWGALSISCLNPVTTAGTISASSSTPAKKTAASMAPVAAPRFQPLFTSHETAGSSANDRNAAQKMIVRKLESSWTSQRIASTASAAPTSTMNRRRPPSFRTSGSQGSWGRSGFDGASLTRRGYPGSSGDTRTSQHGRLACDGLGHLLEVVDVALGIGVAHHDRRGPALPLGAWALEHAAVELPEPRELRDAVVDLPQIAVLVDRRLAPVDRALRAERLHRRRQVVSRHHVLTPLEDHVELVETAVGVLRQHLFEVRLGGRHRQGVPVEGAHLMQLVGDYQAHRFLGAADRAARQPRAERLRERNEIGLHAERFDGAAPGDGEPGLHLVEREHRAVGVAQLLEPFEIAGIGH